MPSQDGKKSQRQKFIDTARELDADEDEKSFDEKLKRIIKPNEKKSEHDKSD